MSCPSFSPLIFLRLLAKNEGENEKFDLQIGNLSKFIRRKKKIVKYYFYKIPKLDEKSKLMEKNS